MQGPLATCCIVLHGHLPYVHHPQHEDFLEEDWLLEASVETYLPLLFVLRDLARDAVPVRLSVGLTPPLLEMLRTSKLRSKLRRYLQRRLQLAESEVRRLAGQPEFLATARHHAARFAQIEDLLESLQGDIVAGFADHRQAGRLEILASAATHAVLPLVATKELQRTQVRLGLDLYREVFGADAAGFWLPECAMAKGLDELLVEQGVRYVILESHGLLPDRSAGRYSSRPLQTSCGLVAFARDQESSRQVWSSEVGYPGDPSYRELYRDLGFDGPYEYVRPYLHRDGVRRDLGIKYQRITGDVPLHEKQPYDPSAARARTLEHARHFLQVCGQQAQRMFARSGDPAILVAPYDMELFGHWWYEGPHFLEALFRTMQQVQGRPPLRLATPLDALRDGGPCPEGGLQLSTWGEEGYLKVWLNEKNAWILRHQHELERRMLHQARSHPERDESLSPVLDQMLRELLLLQSSDWAFILAQETSSHYARLRVCNHVDRFLRLEASLTASSQERNAILQEVCAEDAIFPGLDHRVLTGGPSARPGLKLGC